jgi:hypothetical protein
LVKWARVVEILILLFPEKSHIYSDQSDCSPTPKEHFHSPIVSVSLLSTALQHFGFHTFKVRTF